MSARFRRVGDKIRMRLAPGEVALLLQLHTSVEKVLDSPDVDDPILDRLLPTAVQDDEDADAAVRSMLRDELLASRRTGLRELAGILDRMQPHRGAVRTDLDDAEAHLVLGVVNDLRLAIGARIGIEGLDRHDTLDDDTRSRLAVIDHLGWLQEQLVGVIDPAAVAFRRHLDADDLA